MGITTLETILEIPHKDGNEHISLKCILVATLEKFLYMVEGRHEKGNLLHLCFKKVYIT